MEEAGDAVKDKGSDTRNDKGLVEETVEYVKDTASKV